MVAQPTTLTVAEYLAMEETSQIKHEYEAIMLETIGLTVPLAALYIGTRVLD